MKNKMLIETKPGIKRKLEKLEVKPLTTKAPLKADLILQLKQLQDSFNALEETNRNNLETIKFLEEKIESMEKKRKKIPKETQTENAHELKCSECNFEASNNSEFNWHMGKSHGWPLNQSSEDLDYSAGPVDCKRCEYQAEDGYELDGHRWSEHEEDEDGHIICKFCDERFASVRNLMKHKKSKHKEKIALCENYNANGCPFEDDKCWFLHMQRNENFKCNICKEDFQSKSNFMKHRKTQHISMVQFCKSKKECVFKSACWFRHEILEEKIMNENSDGIENRDGNEKSDGKKKQIENL